MIPAPGSSRRLPPAAMILVGLTTGTGAVPVVGRAGGGVGRRLSPRGTIN